MKRVAIDLAAPAGEEVASDADQAVAPPGGSEVGAFGAILATVARRGATPEEIGRWMDLHERAVAAAARREFAEAMARFQSLVPQIVKRHSVADRSGKLLYRFANADDITSAIRPIEAECGFFHRFEFSPRSDGGGVSVTCSVSHVGGHTERSTVSIPPTKGMNTNAAQDSGIEMQYGMRYALIAAFGLTTANEDRDGRTPSQGGEPITQEQEATLVELLAATGRSVETFCRANGVACIGELPASAYEGNRRLLKNAADKQQRGN